VRSALSKVKGVVEADVALPGKADVKVKKGKVTSEQLIKAIKDAGYSAKLKEAPKKS
jgi:copper chaperone CopZ